MLILIASAAYIYHDRSRSRHIMKTMECSSQEYKTYKKDIVILDFNKLPYIYGNKTINSRELHDDNGVPLFNRRGKITYHPVSMIQQSLALIDVYNSTKDLKHLNRVKLIAKKLEDLSLTIDSSLFVSYSFDFSLHGSKEDTLYAPWNSGMAQGELLSLFVRLYEITNEKHYLETSKKIFNSFNLSHHNKIGKPWVSCVDEDKYLWLEEYPENPPAYTLNGMMFAMFGIYDFYRVTKSPEAEKIFRGTLQTIKDNVHKFRTVGGISHYCLRHHNVMSIKYHHTHIYQLKHLYDMTGDDFFLEMSNNFINDTKNIDK